MVDFTKYPFGLPATCTNAAMVNEILAESIRLQRETCMTSTCGILNIILQRCFSAAKIETNLIYGSSRRPGSQLIHPHVWLTIDGHIVDNIAPADIPDDQIAMGPQRIY